MSHRKEQEFQPTLSVRSTAATKVIRRMSTSWVSTAHLQQEKLEEKKRGDVNQLSTHNSCCSKKKTYYFGVCDVGPRLEQ